MLLSANRDRTAFLLIQPTPIKNDSYPHQKAHSPYNMPARGREVGCPILALSLCVVFPHTVLPLRKEKVPNPPPQVWEGLVR